MIANKIVAQCDNSECNQTVTFSKEKGMHDVKMMLKSWGWKVGNKLSFCSTYCNVRYNIKNNTND